MNKPLVITIAAVVLFIAAIFGYRTYKARSDRELAAQRADDERVAAELRKSEETRKAEAAAEARRLTELKARQDAAESEKRLNQLRAEQALAEAARKAAEDEAARGAAETERLRREKEAATGDARRLAEAREREAAAAEKARLDAVNKLAELERDKQAVADREAARLAALRRQQELELSPARAMLDRAIYPNDYKRREHYYMEIDMYNSAAGAPGSEPAVAAPPKPTEAATPR